MARELLPPELSARLGVPGRERRTLVIRSHQAGGGVGREENLLFDAARTYLASRLDSRAMGAAEEVEQRDSKLKICMNKGHGGRAGKMLEDEHKLLSFRMHQQDVELSGGMRELEIGYHQVQHDRDFTSQMPFTFRVQPSHPNLQEDE
ncbi:MADS-box transcription factor 4-like [Panicum miliaceum]|uniref:MADS-box transcription factor 4-like n=1 Tax=Panicum miliaceum TaxID=4540 RepID=A0A3L6RGK5_PANMI|nr:MADS-box transcription factor 4-like [Panicum miliaceum]